MDNIDPVKSVEDEDYECEYEEEEKPVRLKEAISIQDVISDSAIFEVNMDYAEEEDLQLTYFNKEELLRCSNSHCIDGYEDDENGSGEKFPPGKTPFEILALKMVSISDDGKVKKKEMKSGYGSVVPEGAYVIVHYNAYIEYGDEPYDSTWLRGNPKKFRLNRNHVIPGLDVAVSTMKKGEHSRFLIHPDMGFGKYGCPPRIPGNAELLFDIELINFQDAAAAEAFEALSLDEREKQDFAVILKAAQAEHLVGNDLFKSGKINAAITKYKKVEKFLEKCHLKDSNEEEQQQKQLLKVYVNLSVCYNKQKKPELACIASKEALRIDPKSAKALFNFGKALLTLSDYRQARHLFLQAQKIQPDNPEITEELKKLNKKQETYNKEIKSFSQRAFNSSNQPTKGTTTGKAEVTEKFQEEVVALITEFMNDSEKNQITLPPHLTAQEELCIRQKAGEKGLIVRSCEQRGEMQFYLSKPEQW
ncbi:hypothetical protein L9F63_004630 [Diploptera punctata]|uniref:peptidylprolyl isomerase n=1 Tax=Diploptera punctata TaxID=6984 RepID=A0AAD8E7L2_DIPPU|nr:hypothetical protein L9F63_004630 [Diploptera punctata]